MTTEQPERVIDELADLNLSDPIAIEKYNIIREYTTEKYKNGIMQGSDEWKQIRRFTVGGSSIASIVGGGYGNILSLVTDRVGITEFKDRIEPQWGNLMEHVIEMYVERKLNCKIFGEHLFVLGPPGTSYSPDGITVFNSKITLLEFKAPYSRLPNGKVPKAYIPQVKMGLQVIDICETALFVECVIRRCKFKDLNFDFTFDKTLVAKYSGDSVLAFGVIAFYTDEDFLGYISREFANYGLNDLGSCTPALFTHIMSGYNSKIIKPVYSRVVLSPSDGNAADCLIDVIGQLSGKKVIGILPWKMLVADIHEITKTPGYLDPHLEVIADINNTVKFCMDPENVTKKYNELQFLAEKYM